LRRQFERSIDRENLRIKFIAPDQQLCTDNALMTAVAGFFQFSKRKKWKNIKANANLRIDEKL